jgi:hypothetical protein
MTPDSLSRRTKSPETPPPSGPGAAPPFLGRHVLLVEAWRIAYREGRFKGGEVLLRVDLLPVGLDGGGREYSMRGGLAVGGSQVPLPGGQGHWRVSGPVPVPCRRPQGPPWPQMVFSRSLAIPAE